MRSRSAWAALLAGLLLLLVFIPAASAFKVISETGEGAGQTRGPAGVAVDFETGRLYVADTSNNRVDIFGPTGTFVRAFGWGVSSGESKFEVCTSKCRKGIAGAGKGQFSSPKAIAVDNDSGSTSHHAVYVVDTANNRVEKFDAEGNFILTFGGGVNKTAPGNICTEASGNVCGVGSNGFGEGEFSSSGQGIFAGIGPGGTVYVVDGSTSGGPKYRLQKFEPSGALISPQHLLFEGGTAWGLAVDSTGDFYVTDGAAIRKYAASGALPPIKEIEKPFEEQRGTLALAVDADDNLFAASSGFGNVSVMEFDPAGNRLRRFGYGSTLRFFDALAPHHSASGDIYASEGSSNANETIGNRVLHLDFPPPGPLVFPQACAPNPLGPSKATLNAEVNPEGKATTFHFQYVDEESFGKEGGFSSPNTQTSTESGSIGSDFTLHKASAQVEVVPETKYRCRVVATNADAPGGNIGPEGEFKAPRAPEIIATWTFGVGTETAILNATVNPLGIPATSAYFEYVDDAAFNASEFATAKKAPDVEGGAEPLDFGGGEAPVTKSAPVAGLQPGTTYHYRLVATDELLESKGREVFGETLTFRAYPLKAGAIPDQRGYELVSPGRKNSAEVAVPSVAGGVFADERPLRINAAASSGEAITYTSWTSFGVPEGAPGASQYLAKRSAGGWGTENISPFGFAKHPLELPYRGFTPDLRFGAFVISEPPRTPEAQEGVENLYLRDNESGQLQALTIKPPAVEPGTGEFCANYAGASADGKHAFFTARGAMAGAPVGKGFNLYEWSGSWPPAGGQLQLVSKLPGEIPAPPVNVEGVGKGTGFGAVGANCTMGQAISYHAVSEDGSVAFWSYGGEYGGAKKPLFARIDGSETVQLDAKAGGSGPAGEGTFWAATGDGSKAFFTAPGKLTSTAKANGQLYRYDTVARTLTDLTPGAVAPEIKGVIGASEDGTYAYFVGAGVLSKEEENGAGQKAEAGANNLYLYHEGQGVRFIARLSDFDEKDWESTPYRVSARMTPDGHHLAFLTVEAKALTNYDNRIVAPPGQPAAFGCQPDQSNQLNGDPRCPEAFLYDAEANEGKGKLTCASCNPAGSRPAGPAELPAWSNPYQGPRYLSEDGSRLYFESRDVLSPADENKRRDVYQFERPGTGTCSAESPDFLAASGGCLSLVSSGRGEDETYLLDASTSGRDLFFSTRSMLVGWDDNENYDVYDAREGGGFPEPPPRPPICEGEACKPPASAPPPAAAPASDTFTSPGNPKPKKPKPHKGKKHGKKHHKPKHHNKRRAGR